MSTAPVNIHAPWLRIAVVALIATAASMIATTGTAAAASKDPVVRAIAKAQKRKTITPVRARTLRRDWAKSKRAARTAKTATRRASIAGVRAQTTSMARRGLLNPSRIEPALLSVKATTHVMTRGSYPRHETNVRIPGEPLVFKYYSGRGVQLQPFETLKLGMSAINAKTPRVAEARRIADRLLELHTKRGTAMTWEYYFPFGGPNRPWTSSISQALATEFFWRVGQLTPEGERAKYLDAAWGANESFLRSSRVGGVSTPEAGGRFYVMYPFAPSQRILNGHLQALINVNRYATWSNNPRAKRVVEQGLQAAHGILPKFDTGAWSNYLPGQEATVSYHRFQTDQLVKLGRELKDPVLEEYGATFNMYLETPPVLTVRGTSWRPIIPARDGFRDRVRITFDLDKRAKVTMVVRDQLMREMYRESIWRGTGRHAISWDGRNNAKRTVLDGGYLVSFTVTDLVGNRSSTQLPSLISVARDTVAPQVRTVTTRARGARTLLTVNTFDAGSGYVELEVQRGGKVVARKRGKRNGTTSFTVNKRVGYVRGATLVVRDTSGNETTQPLR